MVEFLRRFVVEAFRASIIDQAFPLARIAAPSLEVGRWRAYARRLVAHPSGSRGAFVVRDRRGYLNGLAIWLISETLDHERALHVECLVAADLFDERAITAALMKAIERHAARRLCDAIHLLIPSDGPELDAMMSGASSFRPEAHIFCHKLADKPNRAYPT